MVMKPIDTAPDDVRTAIETLQSGGVLLYPTETVYGIGCLTSQADAVDRIAKIKGSERTAPFLVLIRELKQIAAFCVDVPSDAFVLMERFWPGPLTLVMPATRDVHPRIVGPSSGVALRISSHRWVKSLMEYLEGGLISTSANYPGQPAPKKFRSIDPAILKEVDFAVDSGDLAGGISTVLDLCITPPKIRREGAVKASEIKEIIGEVQME
jgi:L-threonylcarbamoyladenylate synthase